jgi:probable F420-dependent oxidoreductase
MPAPLKFGLFSMNMDACTDPSVAAAVARAAETAGFESLWAGEHVVLPDPQAPPSPMAPTDPILDPVVALTFLAAHTSRVLLGTGVIVLPQRNPLVLAKGLASLDVLSGGRLIVGLGAGYLEPELQALGVVLAERGPRFDDYLAAMREIWSAARPAYAGQFVAYSGVQAFPRPLQRPHPPIVIGGHAPPAFRRAVTSANGWYGFALTLEATAAAIAQLRVAAERHPRPAVLGDLEISVTPRGPVDAAEAAAYAALGVHRLILMPPRGLDRSALLAYVVWAGESLIGRA